MSITATAILEFRECRKYASAADQGFQVELGLPWRSLICVLHCLLAPPLFDDGRLHLILVILNLKVYFS